jgi:hypothetical protein
MELSSVLHGKIQRGQNRICLRCRTRVVLA